MTTAARRPPLSELLRFFASLGTLGFGGPIALVGYMEREFVERRRWVTKEELKDGIAFSQLAPGPLAAQVAIYLGWLCGGVRGATVSGIAFVGPSFNMVVILAWSYQRFDGMSWLQGAFYGIGAAVIAIVARSAIKLTGTALGHDRLLWTLFLISGARSRVGLAVSPLRSCYARRARTTWTRWCCRAGICVFISVRGAGRAHERGERINR